MEKEYYYILWCVVLYNIACFTTITRPITNTMFNYWYIVFNKQSAILFFVIEIFLLIYFIYIWIKNIIKNRKKTSRKIYWKRYKLSDLLCTDKDFKYDYIKIPDNFKKWLEAIWANSDNINFVEWKNIINDVSKNWNKLEVLYWIIKEHYNNSWFKFIKDSWLLKLDWSEIHKSEFTSYRNGNDDWLSGELGGYGYIWLRAVNEYGSPRCIKFRENWADLYWGYPKSAMRVASQK